MIRCNRRVEYVEQLEWQAPPHIFSAEFRLSGHHIEVFVGISVCRQ